MKSKFVLCNNCMLLRRDVVSVATWLSVCGAVLGENGRLPASLRFIPFSTRCLILGGKGIPDFRMACTVFSPFGGIEIPF